MKYRVTVEAKNTLTFATISLAIDYANEQAPMREDIRINAAIALDTGCTYTYASNGVSVALREVATTDGIITTDVYRRALVNAITLMKARVKVLNTELRLLNGYEAVDDEARAKIHAEAKELQMDMDGLAVSLGYRNSDRMDPTNRRYEGRRISEAS